MDPTLPRFLADTVVTMTDDGTRVVVELARPGGATRKMSRRLFDAVEMLAGATTFEQWAAAVAVTHPSITADQLDGLLDALGRGGFLSGPVGTTTTTTTAAAAPAAAVVMPTRLSAEIIQVARLPQRAPCMRSDLRVTRSERAGAVTVALPNGNAFELEEREYRILIALDGTRDLGALARFFEDKGLSFAPAQLANFVQLMIERGLVSDDDNDASRG